MRIEKYIRACYKVVIDETLCFYVAQDRMNEASNGTRSHS